MLLWVDPAIPLTGYSEQKILMQVGHTSPAIVCSLLPLLPSTRSQTEQEHVLPFMSVHGAVVHSHVQPADLPSEPPTAAALPGKAILPSAQPALLHKHESRTTP